MKKRIITVLLMAILMLSILTIGPESMIDLGYEPADIILVKAGDAEMEMPIGTAYSDADSGEPICCLRESFKRILKMEGNQYEGCQRT